MLMSRTKRALRKIERKKGMVMAQNTRVSGDKLE